MGNALLSQLDARDRALFVRWSFFDDAPSPAARLFWTTLTHLGGVSCSVVAAVVPLWAHGAIALAARHALAALIVSHLVVQVVKRSVSRPRPSRGTDCTARVAEPDRFSFPSGHSAAAMSVAVAYAAAFPVLALPLVAAAALVGLSRVRLGVHYPGDVLVGQLLAVITALAVLAM